jgi:hypothetical protein
MIADLRHAVRMLRRSPALVLIVALLLARGIGVHSAMFGILDAWLREPLRFPEPDRLAIILKSEITNPAKPKIFISYRDRDEWAEAMGFPRASAEPGRTLRADDGNGPPVAVMGHQLWQQRFGGAKDILGITLPVSAKSYRIIGVMPLLCSTVREDSPFWRRMQRDNTRNVRASPWLAAAALGFMVLIVCANVGSWPLGHGLERQHEVPIRGSARRRPEQNHSAIVRRECSDRGQGRPRSPARSPKSSRSKARGK